MIWSLTKILLFAVIAVGLTWGAGQLMETPGGVHLTFADREISLSPLGFLTVFLLAMLLMWIMLKVVGLLVALLRYILGDETALSRYWDRKRERKGFDALTQSLFALASGDAKQAQSKAQLAEKLLNRPELTRLVNAQAAEANGNTERATAYYKEMLSDDTSRFLGVKGILAQKLVEGDTATALKLAEKAVALRPRNHGVLDALFDLQSDKQDWAGARITLQAKVRAAALPKDVGKRREAVLTLASANASIAGGESAATIREAAYQANRLAPDFIPAAALAAELHANDGETRAATRIIKRAWNTHPHPALSAAFASIAPNETPEERLKRFTVLTRLRPDQPETKLLLTELSLAAEDFPAARRALGGLAESDPTARTLALMAAIEKGEGASDTVIRGWLAKSLNVPRGDAWTCSSCNHIHDDWAPTCEKCDAFDTLSWEQMPQSNPTDSTAASMLPLIIGALGSDVQDKAEPADITDFPVSDVPEPDDVVDVDVAKAATS